jgi:ABC-type nitrate/sulfonate/bicarbonate transport system ATPase subunit
MSLPTASTIVSGLCFGYGSNLLYDKFNLRSPSGKLVLKGPSGCGKTTLLKILFGSLKANHSEVLPSREGAALILQEDALFPWLTGKGNIKLFARVSPSEIEDHPLFPVVSDFIGRRAYTMSFGQRRAVELFRVLLYKPEILYMDEPFNYLDDSKVEAFVDYISRHDVAKLLVITTHRHDTALDASANIFHFTRPPPYSELEMR